MAILLHNELEEWNIILKLVCAYWNQGRIRVRIYVKD